MFTPDCRRRSTLRWRYTAKEGKLHRGTVQTNFTPTQSITPNAYARKNTMRTGRTGVSCVPKATTVSRGRSASVLPTRIRTTPGSPRARAARRTGQPRGSTLGAAPSNSASGVMRAQSRLSVSLAHSARRVMSLTPPWHHKCPATGMPRLSLRMLSAGVGERLCAGRRP